MNQQNIEIDTYADRYYHIKGDMSRQIKIERDEKRDQ